jgi:hypothetical protein
MRGSRRSQHAAVSIQQHSPRAASPDINSHKLHRRRTLSIQKNRAEAGRQPHPFRTGIPIGRPQAADFASSVSLHSPRSDFCFLSVLNL